MFKLYGLKASGSTAVEAMLAETGFAHEVVDVERNADKSFPAWFLKLNPAAQVPVLQLPDHSVMTESAAMMIYLADLVPDGRLAPGPSEAARAQYLRWMVYLTAAVYETDLRIYYAERYSTDAGDAPAIRAKATLDMDRQFGILSEAVGKGPYLLGERFSAVDIYLALLVTWAVAPAALFERHPNLKALHDAVAARPAIAPVWARHEM